MNQVMPAACRRPGISSSHVLTRYALTSRDQMIRPPAPPGMKRQRGVAPSSVCAIFVTHAAHRFSRSSVRTRMSTMALVVVLDLHSVRSRRLAVRESIPRGTDLHSRTGRLRTGPLRSWYQRGSSTAQVSGPGPAKRPSRPSSAARCPWQPSCGSTARYDAPHRSSQSSPSAGDCSSATVATDPATDRLAGHHADAQQAVGGPPGAGIDQVAVPPSLDLDEPLVSTGCRHRAVGQRQHGDRRVRAPRMHDSDRPRPPVRLRPHDADVAAEVDQPVADARTFGHQRGRVRRVLLHHTPEVQLHPRQRQIHRPFREPHLLPAHLRGTGIQLVLRRQRRPFRMPDLAPRRPR